MNCNKNKDDLISYLLDTLDKEEKELLKPVENGEWRQIPNF